MVEYPKVKQKLPELFDAIILADRYNEMLKQLKMPRLDDVRANKLRRQEMMRAAHEFVYGKKGGKKGA